MVQKASEAMMQPRDTTIDEVSGWVRSGQPFAVARYGNGEWDLILGRGRHTGSRSQVFTHDLRQAMRETVIDHHGKKMAMQSRRYLSKLRLLAPAERWLAKNGIEIEWESGDVLHWASLRGEMAGFVDALAGVRPLFVGPEHLKRIPIDGDVLTIPARNCWREVDRIEKDIRAQGMNRTVCISAGPTAKVLIHRLRNEPMQLIDCGSLWDVYCGVPSRKYHKNIDRVTAEANHIAD